MSGGLFTDQLLREIEHDIDPDTAERLGRGHAAAYQRLSRTVRPLPGASELLRTLSELKIPWAIATSGRMDTARVNIEALGIDPTNAVIVTRDQVRFAKPDPDLFEEAARRLGIPVEVIGTVTGERLIVSVGDEGSTEPVIDQPVAVLLDRWAFSMERSLNQA